ncbi:MAG: bifunctional folylpolyglutamate synthase/dihydrofolate synthase [Porphyromonadaceae bacterium]|nr:bifunctional folylpolyglutamate synthase/dihydrofolate synthase [Porphyromonadaceae bacterium]
MDYEETLQYLYRQLPVFQQIGQAAYKPGLDNSLALDRLVGSPHKRYATIHIAGTNGKGSTSHVLAAILQRSGYKVGLYTSPHLVDFRERIRVNGEMISKEAVLEFTRKYLDASREIHPSFFELTMMMAFDYFAACHVDVAVIETGLGGRLDSTNIITPRTCVITNISYDHMALLGDTLSAIAREKAGIIKKGIPVVIGEAEGEVRRVFEEKAKEVSAPIFFAQESDVLRSCRYDKAGQWCIDSRDYGPLSYELGGLCQEKNAVTILCALRVLRQQGFTIRPDAVREGFAQVTSLTGLQGRWQQVHTRPTAYCDTGHNTGGFQYIVRQLSTIQCPTLRIVFGMVSDKDISGVLSMLPTTAVYYFTQAAIPRALPADTMQSKALERGLKGKAYTTVPEAYQAALQDSSPDDFVFVGGSSFVVADLLASL